MTLTQLEDVMACAGSFSHFLRTHVSLRTGGGTQFDPYPWQGQLADSLPYIRRMVCLKARQLGMSWLLGSYALWVALFEPGSDILLISQTEDDAQELLSKIKFAFDQLPDYLKPAVGKNNTRVLEFPGNASQIKAMPSSERAGRGYTGRLIVADEHGFHQWAEANLAATDPAIDAGGQFFSLSSANGIGNLFAALWAKATASREAHVPLPIEGGFAFARDLRTVRVPAQAWLPIFLPYGCRPGRDGSWWEDKRETYPREWTIYQEFPRAADEAFQQTGRPVFRKERLDQQKAHFRAALPETAWPDPLASCHPDELRVFALPLVGHRYVAGADVAEGLEHGDYSDLAVWDVDAGERPQEVLTLHGHWDPDQFAVLIDRVARLYPGTYGVERNNHGHAVLLKLRALGTPGIFHERPTLVKQGDRPAPGKPGWLTSSTTKPLMIDDLAVAIRENGIALSDSLAYPELQFYRTNDDGSTSAPSGQWDDRVMSRAIANQMLKRLPAQLPTERVVTYSNFTGVF